MKILYFLAHPDSIGGAAKVLLVHACLAQKKGHKVRVIIQDNEYGKHIEKYDTLIRSMKLEYTSLAYTISVCAEEIDMNNVMNSLIKVRECILDFNPDIIHSVQLNIAVEMISRELKIPHIMNIYPISDGMFNIKWMDIFPRYLCCDSEYFRSQWSKALNLKSKCIRVAYEPKMFPVMHERNSDYRIISVAAFGEHKQQYEIIRFIEKCINNNINVHMTFLGDDKNSYGEKCKKYVIEHGLDKYVWFGGFVDNVEYYLCNADLLLHASICESYPGVLVEAMANRIPVLTTSVGGVPELIRDNYNGFLAHGVGYEELYVSFLNFKKAIDNNNIDKIIENAYQTYLDNHSYLVVSEQLELFYNDVMKDYISNGKRSYTQDISEDFYKYMNDIIRMKYSKYTIEHVWFLYHIHKINTRNDLFKNVYIWGAGNNAKIALEWADILNLSIKGFIDSNKKGQYDKYTIYRPERDVILDADFVLISVADVNACQIIARLLIENGKIRNENFFFLYNNPCMVV